MKKSILRHLIIGSIIVVVISFLFSGALFFSLMTDDAIKEETNKLRRNIPEVTEISLIAIRNRKPEVIEMYHNMIDSIADNTDTSIIVFDRTGTIIAASGENKNELIGSVIKKEFAVPILGGDEFSDTGLFDEYFDEPTLTLGAPMRDRGKIFGGVIFNMPIPEVRNLKWRIFKSFISMTLVAIIFSFLLYYFISRKITTPIRKMSKAVTEFAKGDFTSRVEYNGKDEMGELAANINAMATSLENLENMRSSFVANVSHELRTPMTTISGFLEGILDGTVKEEEKDRYISVALDETKRLSRLVNDLLSVTKMESDEFHLNMTEFNLNELLAQELFKFESSVEEKSISLELELSEEDIVVSADSDAVTQIITNLVHNAVKFVPVGGDIRIKTWINNKKAYVEIMNSGEGISGDKLNYIFDRFYKIDDSRSADKTGAGLGLFIVKNLVNRHDERIWAESEVGKYTKFTFSLTLA